jgi:hypothetical protein
MIAVAEQSMYYQDIGEVDKQLALYAENCTFKMPTNEVPMQGRGELRKSVETWPRAETRAEWYSHEGNRLVMCWNWRGVAENWPKDAPLLRGISIFEFNEVGLIQRYEDFFDPDWMSRHPRQAA